MRRLCLFTLMFYFLVACNNLNTINKPKVFGNKFFDYDQIDYYFNNFDDKKFPGLSNKFETLTDTIRSTVLWGKVPLNLNDTSFIKNLESGEYKKKILYKSLFPIIDEIFVEKEVLNPLSMSSCVPIYRDIFIFKKHDKIVGIAKICFTCGYYNIVGTPSNTNNFGGDGDYQRLEKILR